MHSRSLNLTSTLTAPLSTSQSIRPPSIISCASGMKLSSTVLTSSSEMFSMVTSTWIDFTASLSSFSFLSEFSRCA